jgi:starvation-inducible DNA-binding protein
VIAIAPAETRLPAASLDPRRRADTVDGLNTDIAHLLDLSLAARAAKWNVRGTAFEPARKRFGRLSSVGRRGADRLAARAVALGGPCAGSIDDVTALTTLPPFPTGERSCDALSVELQRRVLRIAERLRESAARLDDDPVSQQVYLEVTSKLESQAWKLTGHLAR